MSLIKTEKEIEYIRESCRIVSGVLKFLKNYIKEGVSTWDIDKLAYDYILSEDGYPAFKGYKVNGNLFPASLCVSINEEVVHGIPDKNRILKNGDIVSIDVGVKKKGYCGDAAYTYEVSDVSPKKKRLMEITEKSLYKGIEKAVDGNEVNDISVAIQNFVEGAGFSIVRELVGHGIGKKLHEQPAIPNFYNPDYKFRLSKGMVIAIEPMVNYGTYEIITKEDGWTVVTKDNEPSAHFEHTVFIKEGLPEILTL